MIRSAVTLGIIAEYDPFHIGHAYHLSQARKTVLPDTVIAVISPCLKQRGELSVLSPYDRAACALHAGIDAVFALPVLWTVRDAEHYALGAVSLLCGLGVSHIAFGAETENPDLLRLTADFLEDPPSAFQVFLKSFLKDGMGYPAALSRAASFFLPEAGRVLSLPNNILGICYLRALKKLNSNVIPVIIPRRGAYHEQSVSPEAPSASAIRNALAKGNYRTAFRAVPDFSADILQKAFLQRRIPDTAVWDALLLNRLRSSDLSALPDLSEGLGDSLKKAASISVSAQELVASLCSRRYTAARINRLCAMALLDVTDERIRGLPLPSSAHLLALRKKAGMTEQWKNLPVRIAASASEWRTYADPEDVRCWRLWASCCCLPDTLPLTERIRTEE